MSRAAPVLALLLALAAPPSAPAQPRPAAVDRCLGPGGGGGLPGQWSDRRKVVHLAVCEWSKFGYPTAEIRPASPIEARSLPAPLGLAPQLRAAAAPQRLGYEAVTPAAEVQLRSGLTESDAAASPAVERYWSAVRPAFVDKVRRAREAAGAANLNPGWWDPWSAAFISWTFQSAGVSWFRGSASHVLYLKAAMAARPGALVPVSRYRPLPGDLICAPRAAARGQPTAVSEAAFLKALREGDEHFETHCDIVVRVNHASVVSIGGNVKNAVTATVTPLRGGRLIRTDVRPWSAALTMGEPYDPCARIENVPLPGWEGAGSARKAALARTGCSGR